MKFFRVEDDNLIGPYSNMKGWNKILFWCKENENLNGNMSSHLHPSPKDDSKIRNHPKVKPWVEESKIIKGFIHINFPESIIFGFSSIDQFRRWFFEDKILEGLDKAGFRLSTYEVERKNLIDGFTQAIADRADLLLVNKRKLTDFCVSKIGG